MIKRFLFAVKRNANRLIILKITRKLLGWNFRYALSLENPHDDEIHKDIFISMKRVHEPFEFKTEYVNVLGNVEKEVIHCRPQYRFHVRNVLVDLESGIAFTQEKEPRSLLESSCILPIEISDYLRPRKPRKIQEGLWTSLSSRSYAHWLLQDVPRFISLESEPRYNLAISADAPGYVLNFLQLMNRDVHLRTKVLHAEEYVFVGSAHPVWGPTPRNIEILRNWTLERLSKNASSPCSRIYISRKFSSRALPNEHEIEEFFSSKDFQVLYLERMDWVTQVELFSKADVIVGPHGAGLANIVFCKASAKVYEIYDRRFNNQTIWQLASLNGIQFQRIEYNFEIMERLKELF